MSAQQLRTWAAKTHDYLRDGAPGGPPQLRAHADDYPAEGAAADEHVTDAREQLGRLQAAIAEVGQGGRRTTGSPR